LAGVLCGPARLSLRRRCRLSAPSDAARNIEDDTEREKR